MKKSLYLILLFISLFTIDAKAIGIYGGLGYNYSISSANNEFWNGGDGSSPFFTVGAQMQRLSLELSFRSIDIENTHTTSKGTYDIVISDLLFGLGFKFDLNSISHLNLGLAFHNIEVSYKTNSSSTLNSSGISGSSLGAYLGGGIHGIIFLPNLKYTIDVNYYHRNSNFGIFAIETGIFYNFYSF